MAEQQAGNKHTVCKQCTETIAKGTICMACEGFCSSAFHPECAKLTVDEVLCYRKLLNVFWMCEECTNVFDRIRKDGTVPTMPTKRLEVPSEPPWLSTMNYDEEISELKQQVTAIQKTLANISTTCDAPPLEAAKQNLPLAQSSPISDTRLLCGTRNFSDSRRSSDDSGAAENDRFWLFLTRIKNTATERDIYEMVVDSLGTEETRITVEKLVPPWKDASSLPYISFKVGINVRYREIAVLQSTWPVGLCFREFKNNVWEPTSWRRLMN